MCRNASKIKLWLIGFWSFCVIPKQCLANLILFSHTYFYEIYCYPYNIFSMPMREMFKECSHLNVTLLMTFRNAIWPKNLRYKVGSINYFCTKTGKWFFNKIWLYFTHWLSWNAKTNFRDFLFLSIRSDYLKICHFSIY